MELYSHHHHHHHDSRQGGAAGSVNAHSAPSRVLEGRRAGTWGPNILTTTPKCAPRSVEDQVIGTSTSTSTKCTQECGRSSDWFPHSRVYLLAWRPICWEPITCPHKRYRNPRLRRAILRRGHAKASWAYLVANSLVNITVSSSSSSLHSASEGWGTSPARTERGKCRGPS